MSPVQLIENHANSFPYNDNSAVISVVNMQKGNTLFSSGNYVEMLPRMAIFSAVVREGGFGKAATALGVSKSNVSKQVSRLEESLGVRLLSRTTRVVRPTEAGLQYYERCDEMLRIASEAQGFLSSIQEEAVGRLRISVPLSFGRVFLHKPLLRYLARFPRVSAQIDMSDRQVDVLAEGVDLAIRLGPVHNPDLVVRRLTQSRRIVVASPQYLEEHGTPKEPEELGRHECLLYEYQSAPSRWGFQRENRWVEVSVAGRIQANNGDLLADAACAGLGLAYLPEFIVQEQVEDGRLVPVLDSLCQEASVVNAVLPARRHIPVKVRELLTELSDDLA